MLGVGAPLDYCLEIGAVLASKFDVTLLVPAALRGIDCSWVGPRLKLVYLEQPRHRDLRNVFFVAALARMIRRERPDLIHCLSENNVWLNLLPALVRPIPLVTTVHDIALHPGDGDSQRVPRFFVDWFIRQSAKIIVHGPTLRDAFIRKSGRPATDVFAAHHPVVSHFRRLALKRGFRRPDDGIFRILFFGRIYEYKGLRYLIDAAPAIHAAVGQARFIVAGRGDNLAPYAEQQGVMAYFDFRYRYIPDDEMAQLFAEADLVALPYVEASQSGVLANAIAFELPVVATDVGEMGRLVAATGIGTLVSPRDPAALATAIIALARNPERRAALADKVRRIRIETFGPDALVLQFADAYRAALGWDPLSQS